MRLLVCAPPVVVRVLWILGTACTALLVNGAPGASLEHNPVLRAPISIGPQASRLLIGFKPSSSGAVLKWTLTRRAHTYTVTQAQTSAADVAQLVRRVGLPIARSGQITPSMHVLYLPKTLYGADVLRVLAALRADPAVAFAAVDAKRYPLQVTPNDPLFMPTPNAAQPANGQWYFNNPATSSITVAGTVYQDLSAVDAVDAWTTTTGSAGIVIADVDTGVRFDHPDLLRAGLGNGGRLLPGYDFIGQDYNASTGAALGTFIEANDGDGWDPDPSDPGDWVSAADQAAYPDLFPSSSCPVANSTWHGTRVVGIFGAISDNEVGIAGLTWVTPTTSGPWVLPVRALGKCGGYDSNIIAGIEWAAGMPVTDPDTGNPAPNNPYPADIINLSLGGGTDACSSASNDGAAYFKALPEVTALGVLVVVAAGNASGPVELPGNCATVVPGVMAVAGLRNVGTKVGYSSFGPQVSVSAPAGNCIQTSGDCLRAMDSTTNSGTTGPGENGYTNEVSPNLGTSFATPIVAGIAALMRSVNDNLTPAQLAARLASSASPFPPAGSEPVCPQFDDADECACPASGQCGSGMVNAHQAVLAAEDPIAAVRIGTGSPVPLDASGSAAACKRSIASYQWSASGGATIVSGAQGSQATASGSGSVTLTVTDNEGATDTASVTLTAGAATSSAPESAGTSACPTDIVVTPQFPSVTQTFSPASITSGGSTTLTVTLSNPNPFALTESQLTDTLPAGLALASGAKATTSCTGAYAQVSVAASTITLSNANVPADGSCTVTVPVVAAQTGRYTNSLAAHALSTALGSNATATAATLTVSSPPSGGGGRFGWLELAGLALLAGALRSRSRGRPRAR